MARGKTYYHDPSARTQAANCRVEYVSAHRVEYNINELDTTGRECFA